MSHAAETRVKSARITEINEAVRKGTYRPDIQRMALKMLLKEGERKVEELWDVLEKLSEILEQALPLEEEKLHAVRENRLSAVEACVTREQALTMQIRGCDRRREEILRKEGLENIPLRGIVSGLPAESQAEASRIAGRFDRAVRSFQMLNGEAMKLVNLYLHQMEQQRQIDEKSKTGNTQGREMAGVTDRRV